MNATYQVRKKIEFCFGHRLLHYTGKCQHLHGHNATVEVALDAKQLDACGMVMDFSQIKAKLKTWIDAHLDHKLILHEADPYVATMRQWGEPVYCLPCNPTMENLAQHLYTIAKELGLPVSGITIWESDSACARYQPA